MILVILVLCVLRASASPQISHPFLFDLLILYTLEFNLYSAFSQTKYYKIFFIFPYKSQRFVCQKDLLVQGTIEEFEAVFEGKIVRKK